MFKDVLTKNASGLGPAIISGPIRGRFFRLRDVFFRLRQPGNVILRYAGVPNREMDCQWEPRGDYLEPDSGAFFSGYGPVFLQVNRKKDGAGLAGQLSFHGIGDVFFQVKRLFSG